MNPPAFSGDVRAWAGFNVAKLDLVAMRLAVLCADTGTLSAAARIANCSVSTGSQRLSSLEDAFGRKLFVRNHRGVRLTDAGQLLVAHARAVLARLESMTSQVLAASAEDFEFSKHQTNPVATEWHEP